MESRGKEVVTSKQVVCSLWYLKPGLTIGEEPINCVLDAVRR